MQDFRKRILAPILPYFSVGGKGRVFGRVFGRGSLSAPRSPSPPRYVPVNSESLRENVRATSGKQDRHRKGAERAYKRRERAIEAIKGGCRKGMRRAWIGRHGCSATLRSSCVAPKLYLLPVAWNPMMAVLFFSFIHDVLPQ